MCYDIMEFISHNKMMQMQIFQSVTNVEVAFVDLVCDSVEQLAEAGRVLLVDADLAEVSPIPFLVLNPRNLVIRIEFRVLLSQVLIVVEGSECFERSWNGVGELVLLLADNFVQLSGHLIFDPDSVDEVGQILSGPLELLILLTD